MITEYEKDIILQCAKKYNVSSVLLFGSSIKEEKKSQLLNWPLAGLAQDALYLGKPEKHYEE